MEPEHFLLERNDDGSIRPWDPDGVDSLAKPCYDFRSMSPAMAYLQELTLSLNSLGWGVYQCDHEDANGQFEVNFDYADALTTSDRIIFFKMATSQIAKKYGAIASHMPKPFADRTGSGLHAHYHLADTESGENLFLDEGDKRGLGCSELAYHFLGGILHHARALCAVSSPTVNCYKRLQLGAGIYSSRSGFTWTPAFITYGDNNRTQMIRTAGEGHFEDRTISAAANPYLALAAYLVAGLDGIERGLEPGEPNLGNMYERPLDEIQAEGNTGFAAIAGRGARRAGRGRSGAERARSHRRRVPQDKSRRVGRVRQPSQPLGDRPVFDLVLRPCLTGCSNTASSEGLLRAAHVPLARAVAR